ncbi:uncharacterized protein E0L32_002350 [Thyridium curvatum]|uniref:Uncharacterized protein n=1 Tax=Thyridium curvatum TaxID=1093900 RepID=A0A507AL87_9PEZI|nr:uncharacterized protein E0L32_002350 [Thyridium curvatum]TPX06854.1 hypothetical protein E0L32_002350 [Thyridium curvatum]
MSSEATNVFREEVNNFMRFLQFKGSEKVRPNPVFIAVMGGHTVPGYLRDTNRSDLEILKTISNFFSVAYANRNYLNGLIYLHQISDPRLGRTRRFNIEMLKALSGEDAFRNIAIVTSMWTPDESSTEWVQQVAREEQLKEEHLAEILDGKGLLKRLKSRDSSTIDVASAKRIFKEAFEYWKNDEIALSIQHELVNELLPLNQTVAGKMLSRHLDETYQYHEVKRSGLSATLEETQVGNEGSSPEQEQDTDTILKQIRADQSAMQISLFEIHSDEKEHFMADIEARESRWRQELASREREQALREQVLSEMRAEALNRDVTIAELRRQQLEAVSQRREESNAQRQQLTIFAREQDRRIQWETRYHAQLMQQGQWREDAYKAELERTRKELEQLRADIEKRLETVNKAKRAWVGPLLQGLASGGLALTGSIISAGAFDSYPFAGSSHARFANSPAGMLCVVQ